MHRLIPVILSILVTLQALVAFSDELDDLMAPRLSRVEELSRRYVDVSGVVVELDRVVRLWELGDRGRALDVLGEVDRELSRLESEAGWVEFWYRVRLYSTIVFLLSLPVLFYLLVPRIYLTLWFRLRRHWLVVRVASRR